MEKRMGASRRQVLVRMSGSPLQVAWTADMGWLGDEHAAPPSPLSPERLRPSRAPPASMSRRALTR